MPAHVTWAQVAYTLVITIPAIVAAYYGRRNASALVTGNDKKVGEMVTEIHGKESAQDTAFETHKAAG